MEKVLEARRQQQARYIALARDYARRLEGRLCRPLTAIVIGSVARGDFNLWSDVDVVVIAGDLPAGPLMRSAILYADAEPAIEPKGYTYAEFARLLAAGHPLAREAAESGIVVREADGWRERVGLR